MNKMDFMKQLEQLLSDIPQYERTEALNYYEEYFSDAGVENEQQVLRELGSPWEVAQTIRDGLQPGGAKTETQYQAMEQRGQKAGLPTWAIVLIVVGCIFASPVLIGLVATAFGLLIGFFGMIIGFGAAGVSLVAAGISTVVFSIVYRGVFTMVGVILVGVGFVLFALGILFSMLTVWMCGYVIPAIFRWMASLFRKKSNQ